MKADVYFQFPISLLGFGRDAQERLDAVIDYCVVKAGIDACASLTREEIRTKALADHPDPRPSDFTSSSRQHCEALIGARSLKVRLGGVARALEGARTAGQFIDQESAQFGPSPIARILAQYLWECRDSSGMSFREFATLAAIYSVIGSKAYPVRITRDTIRARALGYKSPSVLFDKSGNVTESGQAVLLTRADGAKPQTIDQVRWTIATLHQYGHFAKASPNKRQTYFSHRLSADELRKKLLEWKTRPAFKAHHAASADDELQRKIYESKAANGKPPRSPHFNSSPTLIGQDAADPHFPRSPHIVPAASPLRPHESPHFNKNLLIKTSSIETQLPERGREGYGTKQPRPTIDEVAEFFMGLKTVDEALARSIAEEFVEATSEHLFETGWKKEAARFFFERLERRRRSTS